jgi:hypothetical protein
MYCNYGVYGIKSQACPPDRLKTHNEESRMKTDLKHWLGWLESTPWIETPLYPGRAQKPEEQAKYDDGMPAKIPNWPKYCTILTAESCIARTKHAALLQSRQIYEAAGYTQPGRQDELERIIKQEAKKMRKVAVVGCIAMERRR